jgi:hypothetical protein
MWCDDWSGEQEGPGKVVVAYFKKANILAALAAFKEAHIC